MAPMTTIEADISPTPLPVLGGGDGGERADAARNRLRVLEAAERLFAERGPENVSMDDVARAAGVGKGTLFRRFGDRASLARAVLSTHEAAFQEAMIRGEPPLGPGAPTAERLVAFGRGMLGLVDAHRDLLLAAETGKPSGKYRSGPYASYRFFVSSLLREAAPRVDADYAADALLAPLAAGFVAHLRDDRGMDLERIAAGYESLVRRLLAPDVD